jgi:positive regulator of sigma E activity
MVPLAMANLMVGALVVKLTDSVWGQAGLMLVSNVLLIAVTFFILNRAARKVKDAPAVKRIVAVER